MQINKIIIIIKIQFIKRIYLLIKLLPNQQNLIGDNQIIMEEGKKGRKEEGMKLIREKWEARMEVKTGERKKGKGKREGKEKFI